ncbi:DUF4268 domain-containing protein [archaeon]|jgi:hypothetical protein|nr:DUF4268 domain-containing protein [archaeon]MBT5287511.1 DUF4268 domain-containing protein [archaeon]
MIGKIKKVPLRKLWKKEDKDFSHWLSNNIDYLNDVLDFDLSVENTEEKVGPYRVDIFAEDNYGRKVIIENQLEKTDHTHLGQILTYMVNLDSKIAIWIASRVVDEHAKVIDWLNENSPDDFSFYLIQLEAIMIEGNEIAAPLFTIVQKPTLESKELGAEKKQYAQRHILRKEFWGQLLEKSKEKTKLHSNVSASIYSWIGAGAGKSGIGYNYGFTNNYASVEIYLDRGKDYVEPNINKQRFDELFKHKDEIESIFGGKLSWERLDEKRASRICFRFDGDNLLRNKDCWEDLQNKLVDAMVRLEKSTSKYIRDLD